MACGNRLWSSRVANLNSTVGTWDRLEQAPSRLQNGCSGSFLFEGGFDSHAPPPSRTEFELRSHVLLVRLDEKSRGRCRQQSFPFLTPDLTPSASDCDVSRSKEHAAGGPCRWRAGLNDVSGEGVYAD